MTIIIIIKKIINLHRQSASNNIVVVLRAHYNIYTFEMVPSPYVFDVFSSLFLSASSITHTPTHAANNHNRWFFRPAPYHHPFIFNIYTSLSPQTTLSTLKYRPTATQSAFTYIFIYI